MYLDPRDLRVTSITVHLTHLDLWLSTDDAKEVEWDLTIDLWPEMQSLTTLSLAYEVDRHDSLAPFAVIGEYLPSSIRELWLRPLVMESVSNYFHWV